MKSKPVVIVLAAGRGSRFEGARHKLAQTLGGASVLGQTIGHAIESGLPVVVVTTSANPKDLAFCYHAGANAYHVKPVRYGDHLQVLLDVRNGRSLTQVLDGVDRTLRPGVQALAFHVMRVEGRAQALRRELARRAPPRS